MSEKDLLDLVDNLLKISDYCNTITSENVSHRIANVRQFLISTAEYISVKITGNSCK